MHAREPTWTVRRQYLLLINGSWIFALSLAQMDRHNVSSWCPVALIGVADYWICLKQEPQEIGNSRGTLPNNPYLKWYIPLSNASSSISRLLSLLRLGTGVPPARGTQRRVTIARRCLGWLRGSGSVVVSSPSEETKAASAALIKTTNIYHPPERN